MSESQTKASVDLEAIESLRKAEAAHIKMAAKLKTYREGLEAALRELHRPNAPASQDIRMAGKQYEQLYQIHGWR